MQSFDHSYCRNANEVSLNSSFVEEAGSNRRLKRNSSERGKIPNKGVSFQGFVTEDHANQDIVTCLEVDSVTESHRTLTQLAVPETVHNGVDKVHAFNQAYVSNSITNVISRDQEEKHNDRAINRVNNSYTKAIFSWERIPSQICRLCASTNELHPKQSIVAWLDLLNEILPGVVSIFTVPVSLYHKGKR